MTILSSMRGPEDLKDLGAAELEALAAEIRASLVQICSSSGGHIGPNLGVVELTLAIHRVFESPRDQIVFDTGHQTYVHKMVTGRSARLPSLRKQGGLSGYASRAESAHDLVENSHASTALSYADGLAKANTLLGRGRHVVAVIGDGALTGGMAWEALNNIAVSRDSKLVVIVNDNGRSYTPTVGGVTTALTRLRLRRGYDGLLESAGRHIASLPVIGRAAYSTAHSVKAGLRDLLVPQGLFSDLGLKYVGPVDGHDLQELEDVLRMAKQYDRPVVVHVVTCKGRGYAPAERNDVDQLHSPGPFDLATGREPAKPPSWTDTFAEELIAIGARRPDVVALTAAMLHSVGLDRFREAYPDRTFDVGIAEQHATTSAAGMATGGLHPVVAVYSTFLSRAYDQVLFDVALHNCGVTFALDRSGVTGDDGATHNGMWDMAFLQTVPNLRIAAPRDGHELRRLLNEAIEVSDAATVVRFPKGPVGPDITALDSAGTLDVLARSGSPDVLIVAVGSMAPVGLTSGQMLTDLGYGVTVVDPRWVKPVSADLVEMARRYRLVVTIEDGLRVGGCGARLLQALSDHQVPTPVQIHGIPEAFLDHGKRAAILEQIGLTADSIASAAQAALARTTSASRSSASSH
ncbi:MAG TPA: 1-deoxy-D-xylulose-5-phosphate synthase [Galbitalea sp.]|jgi:1-deoxy-D-xylulose-5-phosphate synthase